jgi:ribose 5-phosphate isomerase A
LISKHGQVYSESLEKAASSIVSEHLVRGFIVGLGSGFAVSRFAAVLGAAIKRKELEVSVVPSSMQAWRLARENGISLYSDSSHCPPSLDVCVDGADEISIADRSMIKGGGGALLREKILLSNSKLSLILADESKFVTMLSRPVPLEVIQFACLSVEKVVTERFGAKPALRSLEKGYPYFTESGNVILDCDFPQDVIGKATSLERELKQIPGVVETGIFTCKVDKFYRARRDGQFDVL